MQNKNFFTKTRWLVTIILLLSLGVSQMWGQAATETATDGKSYVVTVYYNSKYYALPNGTNAGQWAATEVSVNANGRVTTATPPMWTFTEGSTSGQFYLSYTSGNTTNYLYKNGTTNSNYNIKGGSSKNYWAFTKSSNKYNVLAVGRGTNHTRLCLYNSQLKWEVYGTSSTTYDIILLLPVQTLSTSTTSLTGFTYQEGSGPSAAQSFSVSGSYLTANITVTAPTNYEVSKSSGSGYASSVTFTQSSGSVSAQTVYVRLKSGLSAGTYNGSSITISSTGATNKTISLSGSVTASCSADPTIGDASINSSFTLTSLTGAVGVGGSVNPGTNCEWTDMGLVWGASSNPTTSNNKKQISSSGSVKSFSNNVQPSGSTNPTAWVVGVSYYVRIYGKNGKAGAAYNYSTNDASFTLRSITYNSNGGTTVNTQYVNSGGTYSAPTAPTKTGYTIGGWYTDDGTFANAMDWSSAITANKELYAKWTAKTCTITLDGNGGTGNTTSVTATYNSATLSSAITNPEKTDYVFDGWYSGSGGTGSLVIDANGVLQANVAGYTGAGGVWTKDATSTTLYAKWTEHTYTNYRTICCPTIVELGTNSPSHGTIVFSPAGPNIATCNDDQTVTMTITPAAGYQLTAWSVTGTVTPFSSTPAVVTSNNSSAAQVITLVFAEDDEGTYTANATFTQMQDKYKDYMHGNSDITKSGNYGTAPTLSSVTKADGCAGEHYKFIGWIPESDMNMSTGVPTTTANMVAGGATGKSATNTTYYAIWAEEVTP